MKLTILAIPSLLALAMPAVASQGSGNVDPTNHPGPEQLVLTPGGSGHTAGSPFRFDLDANGTPEICTFPASPAGVVAIDRNGNGTIDDGTELLGRLGLELELRRLDSNDDLWLDASDAQFANLLLLTVGTHAIQSSDTLVNLGISAIYTVPQVIPTGELAFAVLNASGDYTPALSLDATNYASVPSVAHTLASLAGDCGYTLVTGGLGSSCSSSGAACTRGGNAGTCSDEQGDSSGEPYVFFCLCKGTSGGSPLMPSKWALVLGAISIVMSLGALGFKSTNGRVAVSEVN